MLLTRTRLLAALALAATCLTHSADAFTFTFTGASCSTLSFGMQLIPEEVAQGSRIVYDLYLSSASATYDARYVQYIYPTFSANVLSAQLSLPFYSVSQSYPNARTLVYIVNSSGSTILYPQGTGPDSETESTAITCSAPATPTTTTPTPRPTPTYPSTTSTTTSTTTTTTPYPPNPTSPTPTPTPAPTGAIAGGVAGGVAALAAAAIGLFMCVRSRRRKQAAYAHGGGGDSGEIEHAGGYPYVSDMTYNSNAAADNIHHGNDDDDKKQAYGVRPTASSSSPHSPRSTSVFSDATSSQPVNPLLNPQVYSHQAERARMSAYGSP